MNTKRQAPQSKQLVIAEQPMNVVGFDFKGNQVRVIMDEQTREPWFVAKDVAEALGYKDQARAIRKRCRNAQPYPIQASGRTRSTKFITGPDVHRLILGSMDPAAREFNGWADDTVFPQVRTTEDKDKIIGEQGERIQFLEGVLRELNWAMLDRYGEGWIKRIMTQDGLMVEQDGEPMVTAKGLCYFYFDFMDDEEV